MKPVRVEIEGNRQRINGGRWRNTETFKPIEWEQKLLHSPWNWCVTIPKPCEIIWAFLCPPQKQQIKNGLLYVRVIWEGKEIRYKNNAMPKALKLAAIKLAYQEINVIYIKGIITHSLISGRDNALNLVGYKESDIEKMGWWWSETFK